MGRIKHNGNGEGSIITIRKNGKASSYAADITVGWVDGKRVRVRRYAKTRPAAKMLLAELLDQHGRGIDLTAKPQTVREYVTEWIDNSLALHARQSSVKDYHWAAKACVFPHIGDVPLAKLTVPHVRKMVAALVRDGYAKKTITQARAVLRSALQEAVTDDLVDRNVAALVRPPKIERTRADRALNPDQVAAFLHAVQGERLEVALLLALFMGLRRGEICALRWSDIDFTARTLTVNGTLSYIQGQGLKYGPPKTTSGRRTLKLSARLSAALQWHRRRSEAERMAMSGRWKRRHPDADYVFVAITNGGPLNPGVLYEAFRAVMARAQITGFRLHDLRHTTASLLAEKKYGPAQIAAYLGHAHAGITLSTYTHLFPDAIDDAATAIEQLLGTPPDLDRWEKEA